MAASKQKKVADLVASAAGSAKRAAPETILYGPFDLTVEGTVVGTVALVERKRRKGEPSTVPQQRDANGSPVQTDILGVRALAVECFGATI